MKKLIALAALAAGVAYVVKFKSDRFKAAATKVTGDPRVQSALATASEKAGPLAASVSERLHQADDLTPPAVPDAAVDVAEQDPVSAPEFTDTQRAASEKPDPLTAPLETLDIDDEEPQGPTT